jgi:long-chain acyl-CoA synthetase
VWEDAGVSDRAANLSALLRERASGAAGAPALVEAGSGSDGATRTWGQLDADVDALARGLSSLGLVAGQRVAFALGNGISCVTTYLAVLRAGLVAVPLSPAAVADELERMLADSGAKVAIGDATTVPALRAALATGPVELVVQGAPLHEGEIGFDELGRRGTGTVVTPADAERVAVLLYTSGTSGRPRGAMLSHRALLANIRQVAALDPPLMTADDVVLGLLPLSHVDGLNGVLGQVLARGARLVLVPRFEPDETLQVVAEHAVTNVPVSPAVVAAWAGRPGLAAAFERVRLVVCGAGPLDPDVARQVTAATGVKVEQGYGLTETAPVVASTLASTALVAGAPRAADCVGAPVPGVDVRVVDLHGDQVSGADPGEIRVRGDNLFSGYWPDGADGPDADGWWSTGDLAVVDPHGDLVLVDRLRELVIVSGFNVYPSEVEAVIADLPEVAEAAVIGAPDETTGEAVHAFVVSADEAVSAADLADRVRRHCGRRLARFKRPSEVSVVPALPHSATGTVAKGRLRAQVSRDLLGLS